MISERAQRKEPEDRIQYPEFKHTAMKNKRIKPTPLGNRAEFLALVNELAQLELEHRTIEGRRGGELLAVNTRYDREVEPVLEKIKAKVALAAAYAKDHRAELLAKGAKSESTGTATYGFRLGNRTVRLLTELTEDDVIARLKRFGFAQFVRTKDEIAKDAILASCRNGRTVRGVTERKGKQAERHVAIARFGLKITQNETFFVEPATPAAATLKTGEERAA